MAKRSRSRVGAGSDSNGAFYFDGKCADSAVEYVENRCRFWQGQWAGEPFILQPWQRDDVIRPLFGWKRRDSTRPKVDWPRRYRYVFIIVGKGNGKTPLGGAIALLGLDWDDEPGAEVYSAAADREQASIVFSDVEQFVLQSPELSSRLRIFPGGRRIKNASSSSFYRVLTSDSKSKHGFRPHVIIFDELHTQRDRNLYSTLRRGLPKREQSMLVMMTTAGEYDEEALWWSEYEYAQAVRDFNLGKEGGIRDDTYLPVIYAAEENDDPDLDSTLKKANPNIGASVSLVDLRTDWEQAKNKGPAEQAEFKQLHLNIAGDSTESPIDMVKWRACKKKPIAEGPCFVGIDCSSKLDLSSAAAYFPETNSVFVKYWMPGYNIKQRKREDIFDYPEAVKNKLIETTEGNYIDQRAIRRGVREWRDNDGFNIIEIGYDPRFVTDLPLWLEEDDFNVVEVLQGFTLSEAIQKLIGLVHDKKLRHGGNSCLRWNAQNLRVRKSEEGRYKIVKKSDRKRIDGISATCSAINRSLAMFEDDEDDLLVGEVAV